MSLTQTDRMSALMLALSINNRHEALDLSGELPDYVHRLNTAQIFSVGEIAEIARVSEYQVRKMIPPSSPLKARSSIKPQHLQHLIRMVGDPAFSQLHVQSLIDTGATVEALSRVTGFSPTTIRRWKEVN